MSGNQPKFGNILTAYASGGLPLLADSKDISNGKYFDRINVLRNYIIGILCGKEVFDSLRCDLMEFIDQSFPMEKQRSLHAPDEEWVLAISETRPHFMTILGYYKSILGIG